MNFLVTEIIRKKRDGHALSSDEIKFLVQGFATGSIPDYQIGSWLMASFLRGLNRDETLTLTREMKDSGRHLNWRAMSSDLKNERFADKHSTGGVGDKVSLLLAPLAACLGLKVPMMSGRGLGFSGGTVDKLESISGFTMYPSEKQMLSCLIETGFCMMGQADDLCPADKKLYALRDVTCTVESIPLITASIVSKKWAEGVDAIVFDVKAGSAAFMPNRDEARALAKSLVSAATGAGMRASAHVTRMEEALGAFVGNALEVRESLNILKNTIPSDRQRSLAQPLIDLSLDLVAEMAVLAGLRSDIALARGEAAQALTDGSAYKRFQKMAQLQGATEGWEAKLASTELRLPLLAPRDGFITAARARALGVAGLKIGVGRQRAEDPVDPAVGFELNVQVGDPVQKGTPLLWMHVRNKEQFALIEKEVLAVFEIGDEKVSPQNQLFIEKVNHDT